MKRIPVKLYFRPRCVPYLKMFRIARVLRLCATLSLLLVIVVFVPWIRNAVIPLPRAWQPVSTWQVIKVYMNTVSGDMAALSACTKLWNIDETRPLHDRQLFHLQPGSGNKEGTTGERERPGNRHADQQLYERAYKWVNSSEERRLKFSPYLPQMSLQDKGRLLATWRAFDQALTQHNISYFFIEGSLLGVVRHGGLIPWDDDMDVAVDVRDLPRLQQALSCVPGYTLRVVNNMHWKFFAEDAQVVPVQPYPSTLRSKKLKTPEEAESYVLEYEPLEKVVMRYPFLDVFLVRNDGQYTYALTNYVVTTTLSSVTTSIPGPGPLRGLPGPGATPHA